MSKYHAIRTEVDGIWFASKREALRYVGLKMLVRAGTIKNLELQVPYEIVINGVKVCKYLADFRYTDLTGRVTVEDSKGMATPLYKLKKKLVEAQFGIRIIEV